MPSESVKVIVRCRPFNQKEIENGSKTCVKVDEKNNQIELVKQSDNDVKTFTYDYVFGTDAQQQIIYEKTAFSLVENVVEGYNGTIFAYGQTGCGKTFTMIGIQNNEINKGIIPRTFEQIINIIDINNDPNKMYLLRCSYIEIYNEEIHDLLGKDVKHRLDLKEEPNKGVYVKDLNIITIKTTQELDRYMTLGTHNRSVGETAMNKESSRSHCMFTVYIECQINDTKGGKPRFTLGKLNLVDLAGSERQAKTQVTGDRLKEATKINLSLSALGNVISALVDGKQQYIPYRDSKLTRLLQDSLGGNTKTIMITAVSPSDYNYDETLSSLRYASRAKQIKNQPKINQDPKDALLKEQADEIRRLKEMLQKFQNGQSVTPGQLQLALAGGAQQGGNVGGNVQQGGNAQQVGNNKLGGNAQSGGNVQQGGNALQEGFRGGKIQQGEDGVQGDNQKLSLQHQTSMEVQEQQMKTQQEIEKLKEENKRLMQQQQKNSETKVSEQKQKELENLIKANQEQLQIEKQKYEEEMQEKEYLFEIEKLEKEELERLIKEKEEIFLKGGKGSEEQKKKYKNLQKKLQLQNKEHEQLIKEQEKQQEEMLVIEQKYQNVQDEVEQLRKLSKFLKRKFQEAISENKDIEKEHEYEKEDLLDTIREQDKELKLLQGIMKMMFTNDEYQSLKGACEWDAEKEEYKIPAFIFKQKKVNYPKLPGQQAYEFVENEKQNRYLDFGTKSEHNGGDLVPPEHSHSENRMASPFQNRLDSAQNGSKNSLDRAAQNVLEKNRQSLLMMQRQYPNQNINTESMDQMPHHYPEKKNPKLLLSPIETRKVHSGQAGFAPQNLNFNSDTNSSNLSNVQATPNYSKKGNNLQPINDRPPIPSDVDARRKQRIK